jgi:hypothetical protein
MLKSVCFALTLAIATMISASTPERARADDGMGDAILMGALIGAGVGLVVGIVMVLADSGDPDSAVVPAPAHAKGDKPRQLAANPNVLQVRF